MKHFNESTHTRYDIIKNVLHSFDRRTPRKNRPKRIANVLNEKDRKKRVRIFFLWNEDELHDIQNVMKRRDLLWAVLCECVFDIRTRWAVPSSWLEASRNNKSENIKEIKMCDNFFIYLLNAFSFVFIFVCLVFILRLVHLRCGSAVALLFSIPYARWGGILCMG